MKRVLVAGATGQLGTHVRRELKRRGYWVRALIRPTKSKFGRVLDDVDDVFMGDLTRPETLRGACEGVNVVFSAAGAPLSLGFADGRATHHKVDYLGNKNLLAEAMASEVEKFVYVSVFGADRLRGLDYVDAHEDFVTELKQSGIKHTVIRPTGFFSAMAEILKMAARGPVLSIGDGGSRTNPIHEADLAGVCVDAIESNAPEIEAGGPETYTRREITELAFASLGKKPLILRAPAFVFGPLFAPLKLINPRLHALMLFFVAVAQCEMVGPSKGERSLKSYFLEMAGRSS